MSEYTGNFFDKIGSFIPGYKGYKDKEMRRDTDKLLRDTIVKLLSDKKSAIDQVTTDYMRSGRIEFMDRLGQIRRKLENAAKLIGTAPRGYSGLFDTVQVKNEDLDKLYRHDLNVHEKAGQIAAHIDALGPTKDPAGACSAVTKALQELEELIRQRDNVVAEVR